MDASILLYIWLYSYSSNYTERFHNMRKLFKTEKAFYSYL